MKTFILSLCVLAAGPLRAQQISQIDYTLQPDTAAGVFDVAMRIHHAPATFTLAAAAHPEYDDKYWHYITGLRVDRGNVTRQDSVLWHVTGAAGDVIVRYRVAPPPAASPRAAWRGFVTRTGMLGGGPHTFLYVVGSEDASARVDVIAPASWSIVSALDARGPRSFSARNMAVLMDSPIMGGQISDWSFNVRGVPHRVAYLRTPQTVSFDSAAFLAGLQRYVQSVADFFAGEMPYKNYAFLFEDDAYSGGLEHVNSVSMGAISTELAKDPNAVLPEVAHEFFHTWNLMAMRPAEYRGVEYQVQPPVSSLWFSEGLTIYYADLLRRRSGLPVSDSTRLGRLQYLIGSYLGNSGNSEFSAEQVSRVAYNSQPGALGDYSVSTHLQGEVIGSMLDLIVRDATNGARSMDDVMRLMYRRFAGKPGFTGLDIEQAVNDVCKCSVSDFFSTHVRGAGAINFDRYLSLIGLRSEVTWSPATGPDGRALPDMRIRGFQPDGEDGVRVLLWNPQSIWSKSGLHTGDRLVSINGKRISTWPEMRTTLNALQVGDTARIEVLRVSGPYVATVQVSGWQRPTVRIEVVANANEKQRRLRQVWLSGQ